MVKYLEDAVGVANCAHAVKHPRVDPVGVAIRVAHVVDCLQPLELARQTAAANEKQSESILK